MTKQIDRRSLLKTAGATAALAGFGLSAPAVHSANEKVVVKINIWLFDGRFKFD